MRRSNPSWMTSPESAQITPNSRVEIERFRPAAMRALRAWRRLKLSRRVLISVAAMIRAFLGENPGIGDARLRNRTVRGDRTRARFVGSWHMSPWPPLGRRERADAFGADEMRLRGAPCNGA